MKRQNKMIAAAVITTAAIICAVIGIRHLLKERMAGQEYEALRQEVAAPQALETETESKTAAVPAEEEHVEIPVDFAALKERNPEVYAWVRVPGTKVDYPVLQSGEDNSYYLYHTIDREESSDGAIYSEDYNSKDFTDPHTVLYGHNLKNGTMFRSLYEFKDKSFFDENRTVLVYLPDAVLEYKIFAAYVFDDRHLLLNYDLDDSDVYGQYLEDVFSIRDINAHIDTSMEVGTDDRILTLSTCNAGMPTQRYLVQAVLISIKN